MELFYSVFPWKSFSSNKALKYKWAQGIVTVVYRYSEHHYAFFASLHGKGFKWYGYLMLCVFNPFHAKDLFRYLPKMSENQRFPDVFVFLGGVSKWIEELPTRVQSIYLFKVDNRNFRKRCERKVLTLNK